MINSYYASYSLEYYEIGTVYSFYTRKGEYYATPADKKIIDIYAEKLEDIEKDMDAYPASAKFAMLIRTCGVCIEKLRGDDSGKKDRIRFLIKLVDADGTVHYGTKLYAVNHQGVETDGWEALPVQTELLDGQFYVDGSQETNQSQSSGGKGRATIDRSATSGRVTIADEDPNGTIAAGKKTGKGSKKATSGVTVDEKTGVTLDED